MQTPVETVRLSQRAKDHLIKLKRITGIQQWNILCRWAFCLSLRDQVPLPAGPLPPADSNIEMEWRTFSGEWGGIYAALVAANAGPEAPADFLRRHLERGIALMAAENWTGVHHNQFP